MDLLREFLESSNIHGLFYISTAKVSRQISLIIITQQFEKLNLSV